MHFYIKYYIMNRSDHRKRRQDAVVPPGLDDPTAADRRHTRRTGGEKPSADDVSDTEAGPACLLRLERPVDAPDAEIAPQVPGRGGRDDPVAESGVKPVHRFRVTGRPFRVVCRYGKLRYRNGTSPRRGPRGFYVHAIPSSAQFYAGCHTIIHTPR